MKLNFKAKRQVWEFLKDLGHKLENTFLGFEIRTENNVYYIDGTVEEMEARIVSLVLRNKI